jgi:hypothetical protein
MTIFDCLEEEYVKSDLFLEVKANEIIRAMLKVYLSANLSDKDDYSVFMNILNLSIGLSHNSKLKILESVGVSKNTKISIKDSLKEYDESCEELHVSTWRKRTSCISHGATTSLKFNKKKIIESVRFIEFKNIFLDFCNFLIKEKITVAEARNKFIQVFSHADKFPNYINVKTICAVLYALRPDAFPLINDYVIEHIEELVGKFDLTPEGYIATAAKLDEIIDEVSPIGHHFAVIDRCIALFDHEEECEEEEEDRSKVEDLLAPENTNSLNSIHYGPPGTGKTFLTTAMAVRAADPETYYSIWHETNDFPNFFGACQERYNQLVENGQIVFTTFHQSFSYEDFVEGIRANTSDEKTISYDVESGVFKALCEKAKDYTVTSSKHLEGGVGKRKIWKLSLGNTQLSQEDSIYDYCVSNDEILLGWGDDIDFSSCLKKDEVHKKLIESDIAGRTYAIQAINTFKNIISEGDLIIISQGNHKFRAVAEVTGDYQFNKQGVSGFHQSRPVRWLLQYDEARPKEDIFKKDLSQMSLYQLHNRTIDREKLDALLRDDAPKEQDKEYVLIIDEINRGNISKIFGELITLIEPSKRKGSPEALSVTLPYSKDSFSVPSNIHIIGTMNTADRSLALLDTALRRRFDFIEMMPDYDVLIEKDVEGISLARMLEVMNDRIEYLYDREHTLGHAFFMPAVDLIEEDEEEAFEELKRIFKNKIIPLLEEYFYEDWSKIALVLGDNQKVGTALAEQSFVQEKPEISVSSLFGSNHGIEEHELEHKSYKLNEYILDMDASAFIAIYDLKEALKILASDDDED